jgi:hypothetical protein
LEKSATSDGEQLVISFPQRHSPHGVVDRFARCEQVRGEGVVVGKQGGQVGTQRDAGGAGQGGEVEDQLGLAFHGLGERVGKDEAAFGVGVADLDGQALAALRTSPGRKALPRWRSRRPG